MGRLFTLLFGLACGAGLVWGAMNYHTLRTNEGFVFLPKRNATMADAYTDVRDWGIVEWSKSPDLAWAVHQHGRTDILEDKNVLETTLGRAMGTLK